ncbi:hypothetical protein OCU04_001098 [Sclerotinia nivalis]|uniref:Uncharacterized protein n=1 Tax=Sclerotinia nivalis TaxID=352851 RepID=A0A9X0DRP9_9HELO|nr:hypothetical protein OCU04_001098 [Sclerotinia nivalis]
MKYLSTSTSSEKEREMTESNKLASGVHYEPRAAYQSHVTAEEERARVLRRAEHLNKSKASNARLNPFAPTTFDAPATRTLPTPRILPVRPPPRMSQIRAYEEWKSSARSRPSSRPTSSVPSLERGRDDDSDDYYDSSEGERNPKRQRHNDAEDQTVSMRQRDNAANVRRALKRGCDNDADAERSSKRQRPGEDIEEDEGWTDEEEIAVAKPRRNAVTSETLHEGMAGISINR